MSMPAPRVLVRPQVLGGAERLGLQPGAGVSVPGLRVSDPGVALVRVLVGVLQLPVLVRNRVRDLPELRGVVLLHPLAVVLPSSGLLLGILVGGLVRFGSRVAPVLINLLGALRLIRVLGVGEP